MSLEQIPTRLCCGQRHWGATCPDGKTMCCLCFGRFALEELMEDESGRKWDVCRECHREEQELQR